MNIKRTVTVSDFRSARSWKEQVFGFLAAIPIGGLIGILALQPREVQADDEKIDSYSLIFDLKTGSLFAAGVNLKSIAGPPTEKLVPVCRSIPLNSPTNPMHLYIDTQMGHKAKVKSATSSDQIESSDVRGDQQFLKIKFDISPQRIPLEVSFEQGNGGGVADLSGTEGSFTRRSTLDGLPAPCLMSGVHEYQLTGTVEGETETSDDDYNELHNKHCYYQIGGVWYFYHC